MRSKRIIRTGAATIVALLVLVSAVGCGSDDEGSASTQAAVTSGDTGTAGVSLEAAQAALCSKLSDVEADLTDISTNGTEAGDDVRAGFGSFASALEAAATTLNAAGAGDAATAAENLASDLESLSTSGGEDAQEGAGEAADKAQQLSGELQCS